jgi:hypothetical protein
VVEEGLYSIDWFDEDADVGAVQFGLIKKTRDNTAPESCTADEVLKITTVATANKPYGLTCTVYLEANDPITCRSSHTGSFAAQGADDCAFIMTRVQ